MSHRDRSVMDSDNTKFSTPTGLRPTGLRPTGYRTLQSPSAKLNSESSPSDSAQMQPTMTETRKGRKPSPFPFRSSPLAGLSPLPPKEPEHTGEPEIKKKNWMGTASKRLGLSKTRERHLGRVFTPNTAAAIKANVLGSSPSVQSPTVQERPSYFGYPTAATYSAKLSRHPSPTEKPLPSLPVATLKQDTPVRRSLIDCSEKPLRRSITPPDSDESREEEWPAISPEKDCKHHVPQSNIESSIGESVMEGMRLMNRRGPEDRKEPPAAAETQGEGKESARHIAFDRTGLQEKPVSAATKAKNKAEDLDKRDSRPLSASLLPKPRSSMVESLTRHTESPDIQIRQTKASALRLRQSLGKRTCSPTDMKSEANTSTMSFGQPVAGGDSKSTHGPGPVRNNSRKNCGVTRAGSTYTIPSKANYALSKIGQVAPLNAPQGQSSLEEEAPPPSASSDKTVFSDNKIDAKHASKRSSLPVPARVLQDRKDVKDDEPAAASTIDLTLELSVSSPVYSQAAEFDCATPAHNSNFSSSRPAPHSGCLANLVPDRSQYPGPTGTLNPRELTGEVQQDDHLLSVREVLSTRAPTPDEYVLDSDTSVESVQGYNSESGFRIKRVRTKGKYGPTLRVQNSAERVIMGTKSKIQLPQAVIFDQKTTSFDGNQEKHNSFDVRSHLSRPFSGLFERPASIARSFTDKPPARDDKATESSDTEALLTSCNAPSNPLLEERETVRFPSMNKFQRPQEEHLRSSFSKVAETFHSQSSAEHDGDWHDVKLESLRFDAGSTVSREARSGMNAQAATSVINPSDLSTSQLRENPSSTSRPPTIIMKEEPNRVTAPFLFQDKEIKQSVDNTGMADFRFSFAPRTELQDLKPALPPRSSSRKTKPPPIVVSPPEQSSREPFFRPMRAYGVDAGLLEKPRNVNTFSASLRNNGLEPDTATSHDSVNATHDTDSSKVQSSKTAFSNIRGLFHKRNNNHPSPENGGGTPVVTSKRPFGVQSSVRSKHLPNEALAMDSARYANKLSTPGHNKGITGLRKQKSVLRNPLTSPITPFTATAAPTPSPTNHSHPHRDTSTSPTSASPTAITSATQLAHHLLDLATVETNKARKAALLEISKSMVAIVNTAAEAEKAKQLTAVQMARAELACLRISRELKSLEEAVVRFLGMEMDA